MEEPSPAPVVPPQGSPPASERASPSSAWRRRVALVCIGLGGAMVGYSLLLALYIGVIWMRLPAVDTIPRAGDPGATAFMASDGCVEHQRSWRSLEQIDPRIGCALVWTEDRNFFSHDGVDIEALRSSIRRNLDSGELRYGGSTITMQLARNLFLSSARTFTRKLKEIVLARRLARRLIRRRVLELYLNSVELAPCVYGVEAGARHYFGHGAAVLDPAEAAFLASMVPRPGTPPGHTRDDRAALIRQQRQILTRLWHAGLLLQSQLLRAINTVEARWRSGWRNQPQHITRPAPMLWYDRACKPLPPAPRKTPKF